MSDTQNKDNKNAAAVESADSKLSGFIPQNKKEVICTVEGAIGGALVTLAASLIVSLVTGKKEEKKK